MLRRWIVVSLLVVMVLAAAGGYGIWRSVQPPGIPDFYNQSVAADGTSPGQVLDVEEIESEAADARLWRMLYSSTDSAGTPAVVSALIAAPTATAPEGGYPLVAVGHGTVGIHRGCAPSIEPFAKADETHTTYDFFGGGFVSAGYAIVMTDYIGLGAPGENSYLVGETEGRNILDAARAAMQFPEFTVQPDVLIWGQSQGGHAALFAGQIAPTYAPDLRVLGVVAEAPAADVEAIFAGVSDANARGGVVALPLMAVDAYAKAYPEIAIDQVLTDRGQGSLDNLIEELCLFPAVIGTQFARPSDLILPTGLDAIRTYVVRNTPGAEPYAMPVFIAQGDIDVIVPVTTNERFADRLCAAGNNLTFRVYEGAGHMAVVDAAEPDVLAWMQSLREGVVPAPTC